MQELKKLIELIERNIDEKEYTKDKTGREKNAAMILYFQHNGIYRVLMCVSNKGVWGLPGGKIDPGETPEKAAYRELEEETGVKFERRRYDRANEIKFTWHNTRFYMGEYHFADIHSIKRFVDPKGEIRHVEFPRIENLLAALKNNSALSCGRIKAPIRQCMIKCFA